MAFFTLLLPSSPLCSIKKPESRPPWDSFEDTFHHFLKQVPFLNSAVIFANIYPHYLSRHAAGRSELNSWVTPSWPESGLFFLQSEMKCLKRHMCWQRKRLDWDGPLVREQQGKGIQENCSGPHGSCLKFYGNGICFQIVSGQSSGLYLVWIRSFLVACTSLSQDGFQSAGFSWDVGRTILWVGVSSFLWPLPNFPGCL